MMLSDFISAQPYSPTCYNWPAITSVTQPYDDSLQNAVNTYECVQMAKGVFTLTTSLYFNTPNHILKGSGIDQTIIKAASTSYTNWSEPVISTGQGAGYVVTVTNFTIDANGSTNCYNCTGYGASFGIGYGGVMVDHMKLTGGRCGGAAVNGQGMIIQYSILTQNGYHNGVPNLQDSECNTTPPSSGLYVVGSYNSNPSIHDNQIFSNNGMGMDNDSSYGGFFDHNTMYNNAGWAAISLYQASNWTITNNTISQPSNAYYPYHPDCNSGAQAHPAAIRLCGESSNFRANHNVIQNNTVSSWFGILLIGSDGYEPRFNQITGNDPAGSNVYCADDYSEGLPDSNLWSGNNCTVTHF